MEVLKFHMLCEQQTHVTTSSFPIFFIFHPISTASLIQLQAN